MNFFFQLKQYCPVLTGFSTGFSSSSDYPIVISATKFDDFLTFFKFNFFYFIKNI